MYSMKIDKSQYIIIENETQNFIEKSSDKKKILTLLKSLNNGSGFKGNTPSFLLTL